MVSKSTVTTDGQLLTLRDKTKILYENELLTLQEHSNSVDNVDYNSKVILINRMVSVNSMHKDKDMNIWMVNYILKNVLKFLDKVFILRVLQKKEKRLQECRRNSWIKFTNESNFDLKHY